MSNSNVIIYIVDSDQQKHLFNLAHFIRVQDIGKGLCQIILSNDDYITVRATLKGVYELLDNLLKEKGI